MLFIFRCTLIGIYVFLEFLRKGEKAKTFITESSDRNTTILVGVVFFGGIVASFILSVLNVGNSSTPALVPVGFCIAILGIVLRFWSMKTLGEYYTRTLLTTKGHIVMQKGPYALIRHPGYTGSILFWIGLALSWQSYIVPLTLGILVVAAYLYRISSEEKMLLTVFGTEYKKYMTHTKKLLPFIY